MQLVKPNPTFAFLDRARPFAGLSIILVVSSLALLILKGLNFGIDFQGGTEMLFSFKEAPALSDLRTTVDDMGFKNASIQTFGSTGNQVMIRVREVSSLDEATQTKLKERTEAAFGEELVSYEIKPAGGLITVVLKAPKAPEAPEPKAQPQGLGAGSNVINLGGQQIDLGKMGQGAPGKSLMFEMGKNGKPEFVNPAGTPAKDRLVLAQDGNAVPAETKIPLLMN